MEPTIQSGGLGVGGSNPLAPTNFFNDLGSGYVAAGSQLGRSLRVKQRAVLIRQVMPEVAAFSNTSHIVVLPRLFANDPHI